jgi:hypothetical protein
MSISSMVVLIEIFTFLAGLWLYGVITPNRRQVALVAGWAAIVVGFYNLAVIILPPLVVRWSDPDYAMPVAIMLGKAIAIGLGLAIIGTWLIVQIVRHLRAGKTAT